MIAQTNFANGWKRKRLCGSTRVFVDLIIAAIASVPKITAGTALRSGSSGCECVPLRSIDSPGTARPLSITRVVRSAIAFRSASDFPFAS